MNAPAPLLYPFNDAPAPGHTTAVAPGVGWLRMPLPFALNHINLWLLDDGPAVVAVDSGFGLEDIKHCWEQVLEADGRPLRDIIITHCHPDHLGLATWLAARNGATLHMTLGEYLGGHALWHGLPGYAVDETVAYFRRNGLDEARLDALTARGNGYRAGIPQMPSSFHRLFDGDLLTIGKNEWQVLAGYGHSPEHASLYCEDLGILISGDMLLPRISTNISAYAAMPYDDPLGCFLDSLQRLRSLPDDTLVLPSHGMPFRGIQARVAQLVEHHRERCAVLVDACTTPRTAGELLGTLFPRDLDTHQTLFAMGEAIAHLNHLAKQGELRRVEGEDGLNRYVKNS